MAKAIIRIPKNLITVVDKAAVERGVRPALLVGQAIRFYLAATDPALIATAVSDAIKPLASDLRHIKYVLDKQAPTVDSTAAISRPAPTSEAADAKRRNLILELTEQKRRDALDRLRQKSSSPSTNEGTHP